MNIEVLSQAKQELIGAVEYYELQEEGLGVRLWEEVDRHIDWIARYPEIPPVRAGGYRRVNLRVFPYYILILSVGSHLDSGRSPRTRNAKLLRE